MNYFVPQVTTNDCGFACLKMLLIRYSKNKKYIYLPSIKPLNEQLSLLEIKEIGKKYGLYLSGYIYKNKEEILKTKTPFILIEETEKGNHAVIVDKIGKKKIKIIDPASGKKTVSVEKFIRQKNSTITTLEINAINISPFPFKIFPLTNHLIFSLSIVLEIASVFCFAFSAYFINSSNFISTPIILISCGVILSLFYRLIVYKMMQDFDSKYIKNCYDEIPASRREKYTLMHETKKLLFSNVFNFVINLISALAVNTILILNNHYSFYIILTSIILVSIDLLLVTKSIQKRSIKIEHEERQLLDDPLLKKEEFFLAYNSIKKESYLIAKILDGKRIICFFILLIITFILSGILSEANLSFVISYFALSIFTYQNCDNAAKFLANIKSSKINYIKFYDLLNKS